MVPIRRHPQQALSLCLHTFHRVKSINKFWGALGYIPDLLGKALDYFVIQDKKTLITNISQGMTTGAFLHWGKWCCALTNTAKWVSASNAQMHMVAGVG